MNRKETILYMLKAAALMGVPGTLVAGIAQQMSGFSHFPARDENDPRVGIMGIHPHWSRTARAHGWDIHSPAGNIMMGVALLHQSIRVARGDLHKALRFYITGGEVPFGPVDDIATNFADNVLRFATKALNNEAEHVPAEEIFRPVESTPPQPIAPGLDEVVAQETPETPKPTTSPTTSPTTTPAPAPTSQSGSQPIPIPTPPSTEPTPTAPVKEEAPSGA